MSLLGMKGGTGIGTDPRFLGSIWTQIWTWLDLNPVIVAQPILSDNIRAYLYATDTKVVMQFIIDCSVLPLVISAHQTHGQAIHNHLYKITRTWCRSLDRDRLRALGRYVNA